MKQIMRRQNIIGQTYIPVTNRDYIYLLIMPHFIYKEFVMDIISE